jgi:hypothetical protein
LLNHVVAEPGKGMGLVQLRPECHRKLGGLRPGLYRSHPQPPYQLVRPVARQAALRQPTGDGRAGFDGSEVERRAGSGVIGHKNLAGERTGRSRKRRHQAKIARNAGVEKPAPKG